MPYPPVEILQKLLRFDTTNPPGNERPCLKYVAKLLVEAGLEVRWFALSEDRPNLVTRIPGRGHAPPLLLYGHVDVVPAHEPDWPQPPFAGHIVDGWVWGRGALDMKGGVAMMLSALLRLKIQGISPAGDVMLVLLSDEEGDGSFGARFLTREHPELFRGVQHAIGEFGGFSFHVGGRRFYPIMVTEKQVCCLRLVLRGNGGHGSMPVRGGAMAKLGRVLEQLDDLRLPVQLDPVVIRFFRGLADHLPLHQRFLIRRLLNKPLADLVLKLMGSHGKLFGPMLRDTVAATIVRGGDTHNVIPAEVEVQLDGRLLPRHRPEGLVKALRAHLGEDVEIEVTRYEQGPGEPDLALLDLLRNVLQAVDPEGIPLPFLLTGSTDARFFNRLGIQTYGFLPMKLPLGFRFTETIHSVGERIPVDALTFGTEALHQLLLRFGEPSSTTPT